MSISTSSPWVVNEVPEEDKLDAEAVVIQNDANSDMRHTVKRFDAYDVTSHAYINDFGDAQESVKIWFPGEDGDLVGTGPIYRGIMSRDKEGGNIEYYDNFERHSLSYQNHFDTDSMYEPPISGERTFTVTTSEGVIENVINVRQGEWDNFTFAIDKENGGTRFVTDIFRATGSLYTVCIKHDTLFHEDNEHVHSISSFRRIIGIYENDEKYCFVGYPNCAGPHKSPKVESVKKDSVQKMIIKLPTGEIINEMPTDIPNGTDDIVKLEEVDLLNTSIDKKGLKSLICSKLAGELQINEFYNVIDAYPELEEPLKNIETIEDVYEFLPRVRFTYRVEEFEKFD